MSEQADRWGLSTRIVAVPVYILATIAVIAALHWAGEVLMPLVAAVFLLFALWPLRRFLAQRTAAVVANLLTLGFLIALVVLFMGLLGWSLRVVLTALPDYGRQARAYIDDALAADWWSGLPLELDVAAWVSRGTEVAAQIVGQGLTAAYSGAWLIALMLIYFALGLIEAGQTQQRIRKTLSAEAAAKTFRLGDIIARKFVRYVIVRTIVGLLTGLFVGLYLWLLSVDFAFAWGFQAYLLNYIPMLGSVVAVILPTLFVLVESQSITETAVMAGGLTGVQVLIGYYIDPRIQGSQFHISAIVVLFVILFWGMIWGIPGAVLGVPITIAALLVLDSFPETRWISRLLGDMREGPDAMAAVPDAVLAQMAAEEDAAADQNAAATGPRHPPRPGTREQAGTEGAADATARATGS